MWMNPLSRHFGSLRADDMLCLDIETGRVVAGKKNPAKGGIRVNAVRFRIHSAIHKARPDAHAVYHAYLSFMDRIPLYPPGLITTIEINTNY